MTPRTVRSDLLRLAWYVDAPWLSARWLIDLFATTIRLGHELSGPPQLVVTFRSTAPQLLAPVLYLPW
jgi:hypothetical protein